MCQRRTKNLIEILENLDYKDVVLTLQELDAEMVESLEERLTPAYSFYGVVCEEAAKRRSDYDRWLRHHNL